jgi:hypothetical protein
MKLKLSSQIAARAAIVLAVLACCSPVLAAAGGTGSNPGPGQAENVEYKELSGPGKKCPIDDDFYFIYEFTAKPKMGMTILRVQVFDQSENQSAAFNVLGRYDMPSMAGAHDSGDQEFKLNKKNDYLLPVNIVMPGEWEVKLTFRRGESTVFRGAFRFDV